MQLRRIGLAATSVLAVALVAITFSSARATGAATVALRVGTTGNDTAAEVYYADALGYFKQRGLDVQILSLRNGAAEAAAVAGGALDVGEANIVSMSHAHIRGLPFVFVAPAGEYNARASTTDMLVAKNSPIKNASDLKGKTIAVNALGDLTQLSAAAWIDKNGGDATTVHFIEMPPSQIGAALARGTIDAGVVPEPALTVAQPETRVLGKPYSAIASRFMINGWFARQDWVAKNPSVAKRFADAIEAAGLWANTHHAESAVILAQHSRAPASLIGRMTRATYGVRFDPVTMQAVIAAAVRYKILDKSFPAKDLYNASLSSR